MAVVDGNGIPLSFSVHKASPAENTLLEETLEVLPKQLHPKKLIGDKAYDDDKLDCRERQLWNRAHRAESQEKTTDAGRAPTSTLQASWLGNSRRRVVRYERHIDNFTGFLSLAFALVTLRRL